MIRLHLFSFTVCLYHPYRCALGGVYRLSRPYPGPAPHRGTRRKLSKPLFDNSQPSIHNFDPFPSSRLSNCLQFTLCSPTQSIEVRRLVSSTTMVDDILVNLLVVCKCFMWDYLGLIWFSIFGSIECFLTFPCCFAIVYSSVFADQELNTA